MTLNWLSDALGLFSINPFFHRAPMSFSALRPIRPWVPTPIKRWYKTYIRGETVTRVEPLKTVFPGAIWSEELPPETVTTPLLPTVTLWDSVREVQSSSYRSPAGMVAEVHGGLFCSTNRVLIGPDRTIASESLSTKIGGASPDRPHHPFRGDRLFEPVTDRVNGISTSFQFYRRNYYHTLVDALPRLYLLHRFAANHDGEPIQILVGDLNPAERAYLDVLRPANTNVVSLGPERIVETDRFLHLSFLSRQSVGFLPSLYLSFFRSMVLPGRPPAQTERILITRRRAGSRRIGNMDAVLAALAPLGFRRYEMETLPLDEQVRLFYDAEVVVAAHGAGLANLLFCGPSARLVELFPHSFVIPTYYLLCCALGLPYRLVRGKEPGRYDDFTVDVPLLLQQLHDVGIT